MALIYSHFTLCALQSRGMDLVEILSFLFQLSFSTLGRVSAQQLASVWFAICLFLINDVLPVCL